MPPPLGGRMGQFLTEEEKAQQPKVTRELLVRVLSWFSAYRPQLLLIFFCIVASSILNLFPSVLTGRIIDEGLIGRNLSALVRLIIFSLSVTLGANLIGVAESYLNSWISQHVACDMRTQMYRHLESMPQRFFSSSNQGDIITRMTSDVSGVERVVSSTFSSILSNVITLVAAVVMMIQRSPILAAIGIVIIPLFTLPTRKAGKNRWTLTLEAQTANDEINGILNETLSVSGQLLVKLFCREEQEYEKYRKASLRMAILNIRESMAGRWFRVVLSAFSAIGPMLLYLVGGILMIRHGSSLTVGDITVMVTLLSRMYGPVNSLMNIQVEWIRSMAMFTRIFEYLDMPVEIESPEDAVIPEGEPTGRVSFNHVGFSYNPDHPILKDVSFDLPEGRCIALVGPSGSGKSTIVNLIPRLWDVTSGEVQFEGVDVRRLDLSWLRAQIGIVSQETYLFNGTIRENLRYAKEDATEEQMLEACRKANILDFIENQVDGLDTIVGNRGLKLSGGEKQRISIARVLLKDPALLVFDEATSALDSISEAKIQEAIDPLIETRTSILIAHRLSTILSADEILVIKDGRIAERGTHAELLSANGVYRELYETQFKKALETDQPE